MKKYTKSHNKRLKLNKGTLRQISNEDLRNVAGGTFTYHGDCQLTDAC